MDNINMTEKQIDKLVDRLAGAMIKRIYGVEQREARDSMAYYADDLNDHAVGELARLMTLINYMKIVKSMKNVQLLRNILTKYKK